MAEAYHKGDLALQKYLLLHDQHESLRQHLDELHPLCTALPTTTSLSSPARLALALSSDLISPDASRSSSLSCGPYASQSQPRNTSAPNPPRYGPSTAAGSAFEKVLDDTTLTQLAVEEAKLFHVNEGIKRTLTELLNCEAVRVDSALRTWVQCRLMDTERELRSGRRKRSAPAA